MPQLRKLCTMIIKWAWIQQIIIANVLRRLCRSSVTYLIIAPSGKRPSPCYCIVPLCGAPISIDSISSLSNPDVVTEYSSQLASMISKSDREDEKNQLSISSNHDPSSMIYHNPVSLSPFLPDPTGHGPDTHLDRLGYYHRDRLQTP
jgi:hypothetical protein